MEERNRRDKQESHRRVIARLAQQAEDVRRLTAGLAEERLATRTIPEKIYQMFQCRAPLGNLPHGGGPGAPFTVPAAPRPRSAPAASGSRATCPARR